MRILGLDISTHVGYALYSTDGYDMGGAIRERGLIEFPMEKGVKIPDARRFTRWEKYATALEDLISKNPVDVVYVEGYGFANAHTLVTLVEVGTMLRSVLYDNGLTWFEVSPGTLKKFVTGSGVAKKNQMLLEVYKRFAEACSDDNEADAVALAYYGAAHQGLYTNVHTSILKALKLPLYQAKGT